MFHHQTCKQQTAKKLKKKGSICCQVLNSYSFKRKVLHNILKLSSLIEEELHIVTEKALPLQTAFRERDQCRLTLDIGSFLDGVAVITNIGLNAKESNLYGKWD